MTNFMNQVPYQVNSYDFIKYISFSYIFFTEVLERWSDKVLGNWSDGVLECWVKLIYTAFFKTAFSKN
jgi:hypothetical protein